MKKIKISRLVHASRTICLNVGADNQTAPMAASLVCSLTEEVAIWMPFLKKNYFILLHLQKMHFFTQTLRRDWCPKTKG